MSDESMIALGSCPVCQEGQVGFRLCADKETVVLLCEECAHIWTQPGKFTAERAQDPLATDFKRHYPQIDLRPSRWATAAEVEAVGWQAYLLKPGDLLGP